MAKYYINHACGIFTAPIEYAEKTKEEIYNDILESYPEFMQLAEYNSKEEAEKAFNYHDDITIRKNGGRAVINYHIYTLEKEV